MGEDEGYYYVDAMTNILPIQCREEFVLKKEIMKTQATTDYAEFVAELSGKQTLSTTGTYETARMAFY